MKIHQNFVSQIAPGDLALSVARRVHSGTDLELIPRNLTEQPKLVMAGLVRPPTRGARVPGALLK